MGLLGDIAPVFINRLRLRLPRRITVRLGDLNLVCAAVNTVLGKKQRLQMLGHYYEVITGAAAGDNVTEAYTNCLAYFRAKRERILGAPFADDAAMEADLETCLRSFVVEGNALPGVGSERKIRFPGGYSFDATADLGSSAAPDGVAMADARYAAEKNLWTNNAAIGRIPLVATVEVQIMGNWLPSPGDWVHVQLVAPFHDDAAHELDDVNALRGQSQHYPPTPAGGPVGAPTAAAAGPSIFVNAAIQTSFDAADPERYNCHSSRGGKRGHPLRGNNIEQHRFDALPAAFPNMSAPEDSTHPHAIKAQTNDLGQAGVLFMPSRTAGDRYRLRFFLDPVSGHASDGTEADRVCFETGRFVVYKHILWSNYLQKPLPNFPALNSIEGVQARLAILLYDTGKIDNIDGSRTQGAVRRFQRNHPPLAQNSRWNDAAMQAQLDAEVTSYMGGGGAFYVRGFGPNYPAVNFASIQAQLRAAYTELEIEPDILNGTRTTLTSAQWTEALHWAIGQAQANQGTYGLGAVRDVAAMFPERFETPFLFETAHPAEYNRRRTGGAPASPAAPPATPHILYWADAQRIVYSEGGLLDLMLRYINGRASAASPPTANLTRYSTPGLTVIAALAGTRMFWRTSENTTPWPPNNHPFFGTSLASGIARTERGCAVFGGTGYYGLFIYHPDGYTANTMHEMGHVLYMRHQFTGNMVGGVMNYLHAGWSFREDHDSTTAANPPVIPAAPDYDRCVMGYLECEGEFCGKCQLHLRGWDLQTMPV